MIVIAPAAILSTPSELVEQFDSSIETIVATMMKTLLREGGLGLAAPQIGISRRVAVLAPPSMAPFEVINPRIVWQTGEVYGTEGCLSIPGKMFTVKRAAMVVVDFQRHDGKKEQRVLSGLAARIAQHELHHLDGVLLTDIASPLPRKMKEIERETV